METKELKAYSAYNLWANNIIVERLKRLSEEDLNKEITNSFPSLAKTAAHIWDAEYIWFERLQGNSPEQFPSKSFEGKSEAILDLLLNQSLAFDKFIQAQNDSYFSKNQSFSTTTKGKFTNSNYQMIQHCINHSTYHRGQITTMSRQIGLEDLQSTDYIWYLRKLES